MTTVPAAAAAALVSPSLSLPAAAQGAAAARQAPGFYRYKVGDFEVVAINDGVARRPLDGFIRNAELPDVQKALSESFMPTDALTIPFTTLVVNNGGNLTLIDTGNGDSGAPTSGTWMANFRAAGFDPAQVRAVVFSHFHGDHINGFRLKDGTAVFPNAAVHVPAPEWAFWMDDARMNSAPDAMKGAFQNVRRVFAPVASNVIRFEPGKDVAPGIASIPAFGHTPGHSVFMISSGNGKLLALSDTTNHPALFVRNPDWSAVFDMDADAARATRRRLLDMAASERAQVAFYHAPFPATGHVAKDGNGFRFVPVNWTSVI
jgi:glyoxylase-like metal-dependent hydrolase (beta-lactamase superfamily II)